MGWGRTCAGAAVERVDPEHEAYLDGEHQGEHDSMGGWDARAVSWRGGGKQARGVQEGERGRGVRGGAHNLAFAAAERVRW